MHPADGSVHAVGLLSSAQRGAVEFAGGPDFENGNATPFLKFAFTSNGIPIELGSARMVWQRVLEWIPTFTSTVGDLVIRGTIFAPCGDGTDLPGFVYVISIENRGTEPALVSCTVEGTLGTRQYRVRTARPYDDEHRVALADDIVTLSGTRPDSATALAIAGAGMTATITAPDHGLARFNLARTSRIETGERSEFVAYCAAAPEADGAAAMLARIRDKGWEVLAERTRAALSSMQQSTGIASADRLVNRHLMFGYFYAAGRAIDDARFYVVRSRAPWCAQGVTVRDFEALMWVMPAFQLARPSLAHDILMRICELHGYAPGRGVNYMDGTPFDQLSCLDGIAAYPIAIDRYVAQTGDDRVVEDAAIAEALYASFEDISTSKHSTLPLYSTESQPSGAEATLPYTLHANALVADALEILKQTLDEKTAQSVPDAGVLRAAILRHFATEKESSRTVLWTAIDLQGGTSMRDDPVGSAYWLPLYHMLPRDDSTYRRTVRRVEPATDTPDILNLAERCAMLMGPDSAKILEWLRRADLDDGLAAEFVDQDGTVIGNGGDASISALLAYSVWYAVTVFGVMGG
ncbi:MAG: hypothetical protein ABI026_00340 [Gemmatimonadaceae bacterium]